MNAPAADRTLLLSSVRYLRRHRWQALLGLLGVALGVAIVLAVDLANSAARGSFEASAQQLRGAATHRLVNPAGDVPQDLYRQLFTAPGAPPIAPAIDVRIGIDGYEGRLRLIGLDLFAEGRFRAVLGESVQGQAGLGDWLSRPGATIISAAAADALKLEVGDTLDTRHRGRDYQLHIEAIHPDRSNTGRDLLIVDIATAQALTGMRDGLSHIDLILDSAQQAWVEARLPPAVMLVDAKQQAEGIAGMSAAFELNLTAMSLLALLVGMFLIFNAMNFSIVQRHNLIGRMRALGVTADQIFWLTIGEALVVAIVGTLLGTVLGIILGHGLTGIVASTVDMLYYETGAVDPAVTPFALAKAALIGIAGTLAAAWIPARYAAATPPLSTLSRSTIEHTVRRHVPWIGIGGTALVLTGSAVALAAPGGVLTGFIGLFALLLGAAMLMPALVTIVGRLLGRVPLRGIARLIVRDLNRQLSRLSTATAALMIALAASIGVAVMVESMRSSVGLWLDTALTADLYVSSSDYANNAPLAESVDRIAAALPEVASISRYRDRTIDLGARPVGIVGADLAGPARRGFRLVQQVDDAWRAFDRGAILISEPLAYRLQLRAGDSLSLPTQKGPQSFSVAAVFRDFASEHGRLFVDLPTYQLHWQDHRIDTLALFASDGISTARLHDAAVRATSALGSLEFIAAREIYDESMRIFNRTFRITEVLRYLSLSVAAIGILSALMAIQLERRREYSVLRAIGFSRAQLSAIILSQSALLGLIAALAAVPTGLAMAWVLTDAIQLRAFGWTMQYLVVPGPILVSVLLGVIAAVAAGAYPAWQTAQHPPAWYLRVE